MVKVFGAMIVALGLMGLGYAADTVPATAPTTASSTASKPALPACCGDTCQKMGSCCKMDANGKITCGMAGMGGAGGLGACCQTQN